MKEKTRRFKRTNPRLKVYLGTNSIKYPTSVISAVLSIICYALREMHYNESKALPKHIDSSYKDFL